MKRLIIVLTFVATFSISCDGVKKKTKETINKSGETVGKTATEFFEGVSEGVDKSLQCEIDLAPNLSDLGLKSGKFSIENSSNGGRNNVLTLYLIFEKDFKAIIIAKAFDKSGLEVGRSNLEIEGKAGNAGYFDFTFDKRTYIEVKSKISLESIGSK